MYDNLDKMICDDNINKLLNKEVTYEEICDIVWKIMDKVVKLPSDKTYYRLLFYIDMYLNDSNYNKCFKFDLGTGKMLLEQAEKCDLPLYKINSKRLFFISLFTDPNVRKDLLYYAKYNENLDSIANVFDSYIYRRIGTCFESTPYAEELFQRRRQHINNTFKDSNFDFINCDTNLYYSKTDYEDFSENFCNLIAQYFFDDLYENVFIDISQIIKYANLTNYYKIGKERLKFYNEFIALKDYNFDMLHKFLRKYNELDLRETFYDDIRNFKNQSYKSLINSCTKFTLDSPLYNEELSQKNGCEVYYLNGEDFFGFVRSNARIQKYKLEGTEMEELPQPLEQEIYRLSPSFTFIGKESIGTYMHPNANLTMFYSGISIDDIIHVNHQDSWSSKGYSDFPNELHTPESLLQETKEYPEICIRANKKIKPTGIACFNEISDWDRTFSKNNNIPIILINTSKYTSKHEYEPCPLHGYI